MWKGSENWCGDWRSGGGGVKRVKFRSLADQGVIWVLTENRCDFRPPGGLKSFDWPHFPAENEASQKIRGPRMRTIGALRQDRRSLMKTRGPL